MVHGSNVAIVTGSGRGIGAAIAKGLAEDGYAVAVNYIHNEAAASQVVSEITSAGGIAFAIQADISKDADVVRLFAAVDRNFGTLTALINNGGVTGKFGRVEELSAATLESVFSVNVIGAFLCCREAVRRMSTRNGGSGGNIVNISSRAAQIGGAGEWVHYAATKGALDTLTIGLRARLLRRAFASTRLRRALSTRSYMLRQEYRTGCNDWLRPSPWPPRDGRRSCRLCPLSAFPGGSLCHGSNSSSFGRSLTHRLQRYFPQSMLSHTFCPPPNSRTVIPTINPDAEKYFRLGIRWAQCHNAMIIARQKSGGA
jgi:NADP-dependent 3-hydroxy acid dehydrogenase YdfG